MNKNFEQNNFATQEVKERFLDRTGGAMEGILDMGGYRIINGADPDGLTDFATKGYVGTQAWGEGEAPNRENVAFEGTTDVDNINVAGTSTFTGVGTFNNDVTINSTGALTIPDGTQLERPTGVTGMIRFNTDISQFEGYHGAVTQWASIGGGATGGGGDTVFVETSQLITTNYTLTTGPTQAEKKNAMSAGPVTIDTGVTVTVPAGQSWVIV